MTWLLALLVQPAQAHLDVLIYGPAQSYENKTLSAIPHSVTEWDEATWRKATTADFKKFSVIIVGDLSCSGPKSADFKALYDTRATWQPAVNGGIVVSGLNPACHSGSETAVATWIENTASWAGGSGGEPGLVIATDFGVRDLDYLDRWGVFDTERRKDDTVTVVDVTHSIFAGLSGKDLSGWGDTNASYIKSYPSGWKVIAKDSNGDALIVTFADCDVDSDGVLAKGRCGGADCDDTDSRAKPGAKEWCDTIDNDCDGVIDEADSVDAKTWYADVDKDSYGDPGSWKIACYVPSGYVSDDTDCDDSDADAFPGRFEQCDHADNDCDGDVDESDAADALWWHRDKDGDTYGDPSVKLRACWKPDGYVDELTDCDDDEADSFPGNPETAYDGIDQDCDGADLCDVDFDGYDHKLCGGADCNDTNGAIHPGAKEVWYDGVDQDCDGWSDYDKDRDGDDSLSHGGTDCDDEDRTVYKGAPELPDGKDNDCNGFAEDDDDDGDGLTSEVELRIGSDVYDPDTDGDGLSDGDEVPDPDAVLDSDGDGIADYNDLDDDDDSLPTLDEIGTYDWTVPTDEPPDADGDALPNHLDLDSDADGLTDTFEGMSDSDMDGLYDAIDLDSDDDGIADGEELTDDLDKDGSVGRLDNDDDGDGILTVIEGTVDSDEDGLPDYRDLDSDQDGHDDTDEGEGDFDGDGTPDRLDLDSDDDGVLDVNEVHGDSDGDEAADRLDPDDDGDGLPTALEGAVDSDEDGVMDYLDLDSDDDGYPDEDEGVIDFDDDGMPDRVDLDSDDDDVLDSEERHVDTDEDGAPDRHDDDDDGDGIRTAWEGGVDSDGDGHQDHVDVDSDNDGHLDAVEGLRDVDCDGVPNYIDADDFDGPCLPPEAWPEVVLPQIEVETRCSTASGPGSWLWLVLPVFLVRRRRNR
ncbi:MAG: hypothetical protein ACI9MC_001148 [Kiritimatiellia bacterium]|jgi:uncharacterized protein (TIGR03382 family)